MSDRSARRDRSVGRGLTTRGRCLVAGGIAAIICAFVLDERDLLRVGLMAAALPLFAVAVTALRRTQLAGVHQVTPERLRPGTRGQAVLLITNAGQTRTPSIEISEPAVPGLSAGMRYLIAPIRRGEVSRIIYPIYASRRGRFTIGPPHIRIGDPFDLWEDNRMLDARAEVLVVPTVVALTGMPNSSGARSAASGRATVGTVGGDPDIGVREYRSGDDIRTIHWRASARHDDLMVRLEEPVSHGGATIVLDHRASAHRGSGAASSLETAVVLAASISLHLLDSDHQVKLVSHRGTVIAQGHDISDDVLAGLAVLEPDEHVKLKPLLLGRAGLVIAVLGEMSAPDAQLFAATRRRGVNAVALVMATQDWDPESGSVGSQVTVDALRAADWRVVVVRPGDDLAGAWRRACHAGDGYSLSAVPVNGRPAFDRRPV
ncbi:Uncharacterized conserved protein, DUF58 family, contains vWF domain [Nakamurella panacisegetis]|uniref:Uncharacterized conserved protein, DUF58 family, contains vWF domain n=1 Tax=Nakamurella panacisegetis TaxID=1090615 RepID=A0A1H0Q7E6_9ACTN|nr:DUF58 domain-containing protein [Nakamurella panacisegetis]SDP13311.1 Uncharacterized conserved protein, DUF58 family, contains vWF domain [Nakamurella panacisegetis]